MNRSPAPYRLEASRGDKLPSSSGAAPRSSGRRARPKGEPISVLIADDHRVVRAGIRRLLESEADIRVVGEAADGLEVLRMTARLEPDVLLLDLVLPGLDGQEVVRRLSGAAGAPAIVVLSAHASESKAVEVLRRGAIGYVPKAAVPTDLLRAVREAAEGRSYLAPPLDSARVSMALQKSSRVAESGEPYDALTNREKEVLQLSAEGLSSVAMADRLGISPRTIETHRGNLMRKLGLRTRIDLVRYAIRKGLIPLEDQEP